MKTNKQTANRFDYLKSEEFTSILVNAQTHTMKYLSLWEDRPYVNFLGLVQFIYATGKFPNFEESKRFRFCSDITVFDGLSEQNFFIFAPKRATQNGAEIWDRLAELRSELARIENQLADLRQENFRFYRDGYNRSDMYLVDYCDELHIEIDNLEHDEDYKAFCEMENWGFTI